MKIGLAGLGRAGEWQVDIDVIIDNGASPGDKEHGLTISGPVLYLQIREIRAAKIVQLLSFLQANGTAPTTLQLDDCFGGFVEFAARDAQPLLVRIAESRPGRGTNLFEARLLERDSRDLVAALAQAVTDASLR